MGAAVSTRALSRREALVHRARRSFGLRGLGTPPAANDPMAGIAMPVGVSNLPIWLYPPVDWENLDQLNYVNLPAIAATATIISYTIPAGRHAVIQKVGNNFVGGGWVEGSGAVTWAILVDGFPPPGATSYASILGSLGSPASPTGISGFRVFENQVLTLVVNNVSVVLAGQLAGGRLTGYLYPKDSEAVGVFI